MVEKYNFFKQFLTFQRNFGKLFKVFMDWKSETVQQQLNALSRRLSERLNAGF